MAQEWALIDYTDKRGGYLQLTRKGQCVADFFPFAKGVDESWVRDQARLIVQTMNNPPGQLVIGDKNPAPHAAAYIPHNSVTGEVKS